MELIRAIPIERLKWYETAFEREVYNGIEIDLPPLFLAAYVAVGVMPIGEYWIESPVTM